MMHRKKMSCHSLPANGFYADVPAGVAQFQIYRRVTRINRTASWRWTGILTASAHGIAGAL